MSLQVPTEFELEQLKHFSDPVKAHEYYIRSRELKGRKIGTVQPERLGSVRRQENTAKADQRKELQVRVQNLSEKLAKLETLIRKREQAEASINHKFQARKERAAKEHDKPKSAAEKARITRHNKQLMHQAEEENSGTKLSISDLKALATKVKGQIAVAKQKLSAL